ncbi:hypothetical protein [Vibrio phage vB_VmeM-Yong XC32]|nr:hypothetical protein [Vibrio phage vB_VmeM-Yong XC31]QAX96325.1 hypothetical protein [Vibrio phage vB_VmeM-Yong XC32]QAX96643.1 hypothetical protein [Vibrio phage vB_VmeM-Yong MS31]QAX96961.1 hypothetical protein [Vibrio phage vB_VmeM-Yong MS32]
MPLFDEEEDIVEVPEPDKVVEEPDTPSVYETEVKHISPEIRYEGDPWEVTYYSQLLGGNSFPQRLDMGLSRTIQQYVRIKDYVILQTDSLSHDTDDQQITTLTGTSNLYPGVEPNAGDMFIARMSDNRWGLFTVTQHRRSGYYGHRTNEITYEFVDYMSDDYQRNLDLKTAETLYFDSSDPLAPGMSKQKRLESYDIATRLNEVIHWWWDEYYDLDTQTAIGSVSEYRKVYDEKLTEFMARILPEQVTYHLPAMKRYVVPSKRAKKSFASVWDILADGEPTHLRRVDRYVHEVTKREFLARHIYSAVAFSKVDYVAVPHSQPSLLGLVTYTENEYDGDDTYVFSKAFYDHDLTAMTPLEVLVNKVLRQESYTLEEVIKEIEALYEADRMVIFYRIPVICWLLIQLL